MRKIKRAMLFATICLIIGILSFNLLSKDSSYYTKAMKHNWSINLPGGYERVYDQREDKSSANVLGDGNRYTVIKYNENPEFEDEITWTSSLSNSNKLEIVEVLETLEITLFPNVIDSNLKYYFQTKSENKLWMIYDEDNKFLYIIEKLM